MNKYEKLAQRIVALGVGEKAYGPHYKFLTFHGGSEFFCKDWRVAGALMEMVPTVELAQLVNSQGYAAQAATEDCLYLEFRHESAPVAICEACCDALEDKDETNKQTG